MIQAVFTISPSHILSSSISVSQLTSWFQRKTPGAAIELKYLANKRDVSIVTPLSEPHQQGLELDLQPSYW
jgi:hypothetical protein